ncbi:cation-transporting P-type ATPase [Rhodohalobacter sp.]|uniref:cation-translocating P-type ATPase n=1 Tax=Rhodohalobacter sp. TaxID=1974210 RepID=UPI002ACE2A5E|nr:cation-transporting P-type ATPase [Rhodohalobacter sp.]MDZ7757717.1 cation-transporting P-type ATPase [Rhodohalobacter sp.]
MNENRNQDYHNKSVKETLDALESDVESGLTKQLYNKRKQEYGPNRLREVKQRSRVKILIDQFKSIVILVLLIAAILAFAFQHLAEGIAVLAVLLVNTLIGYFTELKATRSMEALRHIQKDKIRVRRNGTEEETDTESLVPGDIIILESGDLVPADIRIIESNNLQINESALTGESVPVQKKTDAVDADSVLADRWSMAFNGTVVTDGSGLGIVTGTGMNTELGRISELAESAEKSATPLQKKLDNLGKKLAWITIGIAVLIAIAGFIVGQDPRIMIETSIALGIAAIPEGLPIVTTIALARGMHLLAKKNALINKLQAVETLGATNIIFTDKTGTLTENHMTVHTVAAPSGEFRIENEEGSGKAGKGEEDAIFRRILEVGVLCNNASIVDEDDDLEAEEEQGDPTETALLRAGLLMNLDREKLIEEKKEIREEAFDSDTMMMATYHQSDGDIEVAVKGAPERLLDVCSTIVGSDPDSEKPLTEEEKNKWLKHSEKLAENGLRLLAVADKKVKSEEAEPYEELRFLGLIGLLDPARDDVGPSISECQSAGIRVIMVTGDQAPTASAIAKETGITEDDSPTVYHGKDLKDPEKIADAEREKMIGTNIFARVSPTQKMHLVKMMQKEGHVVAMTGDGINDTPALKKADIGVAMGQRGTDAARQISDMVLLDDAFKTIVSAVRYGRIIFENIRKSVMFMLCTNVAEILAVTIATIIGGFLFFPLPLLPLQILYLNVITDVFPALALGMGKGEPGIMNQKPHQKNEPVLTKSHWLSIGGWSFIISVCVLAALALAIYRFGFDQEQAVTISFLTLAFGKLWFVFNLRSPGSRFLSNEIIENRYVAGAIFLCVVLLLAAVYLPGLSDVLGTQDPGQTGWFLLLGMSLVPFVIGQGIRAFQTTEEIQNHN